MKKNNWLIALCAIAFSVLFYEQNPGINFLIFSCLAGGTAFLINREKVRPRWYFYLTIHLLTAWNIFFIDSALSVFAWVISFIFLIGSSLHTENSSMLQFLSAFASPVSASGKLFSALNTRSEQSQRHKKIIYLAAFVSALLFVLIFLALYKGANPLFDEFTNAIDLSWFNLPFILMTFIGFILVLTLVYPYRNEKIAGWDHQKLNSGLLPAISGSGGGMFASLTGSLIFGGLNIMLLLLNVLDINYIFIAKDLPEGINLSDFVHDSVGAIVFSIILAVTIILLTRRFGLNSKIYRLLVYTWIGQSLVMLFHTFIRNSWYISAFELTELRIGVFVFLSLCAFGLIFTAYVLRKNKTSWLLFDLNGKTWFLALALCSCLSWGNLITRYNVSNEKPGKVDINYILGLSNNTALLLDFYAKHPELFDDYQLEELTARKKRIIWAVEHQNWQEYSLGKTLQYRQLKKQRQ